MWTLIIVFGTLMVLLFALGVAGEGIEKLEGVKRMLEDNDELRMRVRKQGKQLRDYERKVRSLQSQQAAGAYLHSTITDERVEELEKEVQYLRRVLRVKKELMEKMAAPNGAISPHQSPAVTASPQGEAVATDSTEVTA